MSAPVIQNRIVSGNLNGDDQISYRLTDYPSGNNKSAKDKLKTYRTNIPGLKLGVSNAYYDRIVKHAFQDWSRACICPPKQPMCTCGGKAHGSLIQRKPILAREDEMAANPRARSALLRAWRSAA